MFLCNTILYNNYSAAGLNKGAGPSTAGCILSTHQCFLTHNGGISCQK